jgi:hypothetical protein
MHLNSESLSVCISFYRMSQQKRLVFWEVKLSVILILFLEEYKLWSSSLCSFLQPPVTSFLFGRVPRLRVRFRNKLIFLRWEVVSPTPNFQTGGPSLVGCPRLLIQYICSYPPYLEGVSSIRNLRTRLYKLLDCIYPRSVLLRDQFWKHWQYSTA